MDRDLDDEVGFHLERRVGELVALGLSRREAEDAARRRFGDLEDLREYHARLGERRARRTRVLEWYGEWVQDLRFAFRQFRRAPALVTTAVLTLALGIGANTAIFSVVRHLLLAPLPYPDGNRIVTLVNAAGDGDIYFGVDATLLRAWDARAGTLETVAAARERTSTLGTGSEPDSVTSAVVTPAFLRLLGVRPAIGRDFTRSDVGPGSAGVAMIGHALWQQRYGARPDVLGALVQVDDRTYTIIGVAPPGVSVPMSRLSMAPRPTPDVWLPVSLDSTTGSFEAFARLRPAITPLAASQELQAIMASLPDTARYGSAHVRAMRAQDFLATREVRTVQVLFAAAGLLLLIACANVANLLLVRAWSRRREFAVRVALGAARWRLVRQVLTESVALALIGGGLGLLAARAGLRLLLAMRPPSLEYLAGVRIEPAVLGWSAAVSVTTGLLFGSAPALLFGARVGSDSLRADARSTPGGTGTRRVRAGLVVTQVALSLVLLTGAGLLVRSYIALQRTPLGFEPQGLVSVGMGVAGRIDGERRDALRAVVLERLQALPGVAGAAVGSLPGSGFVVAADLEVEGSAAEASPGIRELTTTFASADYFRVAGIALLEGRPFEAGAAGERTGEVVLSQSLARRLWPDGRVIGSRLRTGPTAPWATVVGVVADVRMPGMRGDQHRFQLYRAPIPQVPSGALLVRTTLPTATLVPTIQHTIRAVDPALRAGGATTGDAYLGDALAPARFAMALLGALGIAALLLATVGLYGVIAYTVSQRTREIGVRVALGAEPRTIARLVLVDGIRLALGGVLVGLLAATVLTRGLSSLLYGVAPVDPATFVAIALLLVVIALIASYGPARRALRVAPTEALRAD